MSEEEVVSPQPNENKQVDESSTLDQSKKAESAAAGAAPQPEKAVEFGISKEELEAAVLNAAKIEGDISMRRSPWKSSAAALRYVSSAAKTSHVQIRTSDRVTIIALLFFCIAEVLSLVYTPLAGFRFAFMCCCDFILGSCILLFLIYRVGILSALNTRQALICWQLMMGCVFLGIFLCLNTIFGIAYLVETFFPHPPL